MIFGIPCGGWAKHGHRGVFLFVVRLRQAGQRKEQNLEGKTSTGHAVKDQRSWLPTYDAMGSVQKLSAQRGTSF